MGIISLVFNRPSCGRFNNILFGHAENIQYSMNYRAKRNSPIKSSGRFYERGLQKQQSTCS